MIAGLIHRLAVLTIVALVMCAAQSARAGGGPENLFLVVNSASWASQTVANHFIDLRHVSPRNVLYINWSRGIDTISAQDFREKILIPALTSIRQRGLEGQIDYLIYSSDFPTSVNLGADFPASPALPDQSHPTASLNGATYLAQWTLAKDLGAVGLHVNEYMRAATGRKVAEPSHGFHTWYGWGADGSLLEAGGQRYMLSTMLAVTSGRGNSVAEAIRSLRQSSTADGAHPRGTIYFMRNDDVRSQVRHEGFAEAAMEIQKLGVGAQVMTGILPQNRADVQGLMVGAKEFSWPMSRSTILPGAICEHFTSFGGDLKEHGGQTPLTEFLRYGAAGASGTVYEPYAIADKFPLPSVQLHYVRGCSLAESFYQSVWGPYQLLIVGDPLCQPWADIPIVTLPDIVPADASPRKPLPPTKVSGTVLLKPQAMSKKSAAIDHFDIYLDGAHWSRSAVGETVALDTQRLADGYHELRVVAVAAGPIETQGRLIAGLLVDNQGGAITVVKAPKAVRWGETFTISLEAPGQAGVVFFNNGRNVGRLSGERGEATIDTRLMGAGPVTLTAIGLTKKANQRDVTAAPITVFIRPATPLPALTTPALDELRRGLRLKLASGESVTVDETRDPNWLATAGVKPQEEFELEGFFEVSLDETKQFQVVHKGRLKMTIDGALLYEGDAKAETFRYLPVSLAKGLHRLQISGTASDSSLRIYYGGPGTISLSGSTFRHEK